MTSCHHSPLKCRTEYIYPTYLASEQIDTPDPYRLCYYGQQIVVRWKLPYDQFVCPLDLIVHVRYGTREVQTLVHSVTTSRGYWTYRLINRDYWCREGIVSYKVELCQDGRLVDQWTHHLWTEILEISQKD